MCSETGNGRFGTGTNLLKNKMDRRLWGTNIIPALKGTDAILKKNKVLECVSSEQVLMKPKRHEFSGTRNEESRIFKTFIFTDFIEDKSDREKLQDTSLRCL